MPVNKASIDWTKIKNKPTTALGFGLTDATPVLATAVASTSGSSIDFVSIPTWAKKITVMFSEVSLNGTNDFLIQIGDTNGIKNTGYISAATLVATGTSTGNSTNGFLVTKGAAAAETYSGEIIICNITGNSWVSSGVLGRAGTTGVMVSGGAKTLSAALDRIRITSLTGLDQLDLGSINIMWE